MRQASMKVLPPLFLLLFILASPVDAQRNERIGNDRVRGDRGRVGTLEQIIFGRDSDIYDRDGRVYRRGNGSGKVPPGWCRGVGNPHRTVENCGYGRNVGYERGRGAERYREAHERFHRDLDRRYERLAARRPLDIAYRLELEARKRAEHREWHERMGVPH